MKFEQQIDLANTIRETLEQLEISTLRDNLPEWRDFLLERMTQRLEKPLKLVGSEAHPYDALPIITVWESLSWHKEPNLDALKRVMNSRHPLDWGAWGTERDNRQVSFPPVNGLRLQVKVGYIGEMFWRLAFEDADCFREAVEHFNLQIDWKSAEDEIEKQLAAARKQQVALRQLKDSAAVEPCGVGAVDWKFVLRGGKAPEKIALPPDWINSRIGQIRWVYIRDDQTAGYALEWDSLDVSLEAALSSMYNSNELALYRYEGDNVAVLEKVNSAVVADALDS